MKKSFLFYLFIVPVILMLLFYSCSKECPSCPACPSEKQVFSQTFRNGVSPSSGYTGVDDTCVYQGTSTTAYGTTGYIIVGFQDLNKVWYGMLRFDLTSIPQQAKITKVYLFLNAGGISGASVSLEFYTLRNYNWAKNTLTYNDWILYVGYGSLLASTTITTSTPAQMSIELNNSAFQDLVSKPSENFGIFIKSTVSSGPSDTYVLFRSSEYTITNATPSLTIYYTLD